MTLIFLEGQSRLGSFDEAKVKPLLATFKGHLKCVLDNIAVVNINRSNIWPQCF